jgi:hypothetical protein
MDPADAEHPDEPEKADLAATADTEFPLPATDTGPAPSQVQIDPRSAAFIALVLVATAWSGTQRREDPTTA